jgi:hypothetical protein
MSVIKDFTPKSSTSYFFRYLLLPCLSNAYAAFYLDFLKKIAIFERK